MRFLRNLIFNKKFPDRRSAFDVVREMIEFDNLSQVVQEYERAVIFRLGRLKQGGAKVGTDKPRD